MVAHVITSYAQFTEWAINMRESDEGGASSYLRFLAVHSPATTYKALFDASRSSALLDALPTGAQLSPTDQAAMKTIFKAVAEVAIKVELMQKRFNLERIGEDTGQPGGGQFEASTLDHMWDLFERVPPRELADSDFLEQITRLPNTAAASGVTGSNRVGLGYDPTKMADVEGPAPGTGPGPGAYTDAGDQMQGMNVFDTTLLHELGHVSDREHGWTRDGGPFDTNPDLGAWQNHGTDTDDLVELWCADATLNLSATVSAAEMPDVKEAYRYALDNHLTNVQAAFQALCTAGGGPAWGTAGDTWQPLSAKVSGHAVTRIVGLAQNKTQQPWQTPPPAAGGRIYHDTGYSWLNWVSYRADTRVGKLSWYAFRAKNDFFAEMFATYYATTPPGTAVNAWKPAIYQWFRQNVDAGYHTEATP